MSTTVEYILDVETQRAQKGLRQTDKQTQRTGRSFRSLRSQARGLSGSFQSIGEASSLINPQLGALADTAMTLGGAFRGLGRALASGNPIIIGLTAGVIAAVGAYTLFTGAAERAKKNQEVINKSIEKTNKILDDFKSKSIEAADSLNGYALAVNELVFEYKMMSGEISEAEVKQLRMEKSIVDMEDEITVAAEKRVSIKQEELRQLQAQLKMFEIMDISLKKSGDKYDHNFRLTENGRKNQEQIAVVEKEIRRTESEIVDIRKESTEQVKAQSEEYKKAVEGIAKLKKEEEERRKREEQRSKALAAAKQRQNQLLSIFNKMQSEAEQLSSKITQDQIKRLEPVARVNAEYQQELVALQRIEEDSLKQLESAEKIAKTKRDQARLVEIQNQRTELLASTEKARADAEINRQKKLSEVYSKQSKKRAKEADKIASQLEKQNRKELSLITELQSIFKEATSDQLSDLDKINQAEQERLTQLILIGKQLGINTDEVQAAVKARAQRERADLGGTGGAISGAAGAIQAVVEPSGLVDAIGTAFGEEGRAVATIVNALSALGEKTPEQLQQEFETFFLGIAKGIEMLAPLLIEILPPILFDAVGHIIDALIQLPSQIIAGFFKVTSNLLGGIIKFFRGDFFKAIGDFFTNLFAGFVELITAPFESLFGGSKMGGGKMLSGQGGLRFTGSKRGLAMLHEGETVVPASGQVSSTVSDNMQRFSGSKNIVININSAVTERSAIEELVRKIEQQFEGFGSSTSTLFGGV